MTDKQPSFEESISSACTTSIHYGEHVKVIHQGFAARLAKQADKLIAEKEARIRELEEKVIGLWCLLDDIDTASDLFKPKQYDEDSYRSFYNYSMLKAVERHSYASSDGHSIEMESAINPER